MTIRRLRDRRKYGKHSMYANEIPYPYQILDYTANVSNRMAERFYRQHGVKEVEEAFEISPRNKAPLMYTKHCLRYSMGWCPVHHKIDSPYKEPFFLRYKDRLLRLVIDCGKCQMLVWNAE